MAQQKKKKIWFLGNDNLRSLATARPAPSPPHPSNFLLNTTTSTNIQIQACRQTHTHTLIIMLTCWPILLRRREMLSNSAFQHSTSDYLFSFTGRFELVMYFPFSASLTLSSFLPPPPHTHWEFLVPQCMRATRDRNLEVRPLFHMSRLLCCLIETH